MSESTQSSIKMSISIGIWAAFCLSVAFVAGLTWSVKENRAKQNFDAAMRMIAVSPPTDQPEMTQQSIEIAMDLYGIHLPENTNFPVLDMTLEDRGSTTRSLGGDFAVVKIGPAAFDSWAILGSTLAHEIEVHCQQSFPLIYTLDLIGMEGTVLAERQAYEYELNNVRRFGLGKTEAMLIKNTLDFYYNYSSKNTRLSNMDLRPHVQAWFQRVFMSLDPH